MKKVKAILGAIVCALSISMFACESATQINCASISEITTAGSENYGVRISYQEDSRIEGKATDVQVKFSKLGQYTFWEENGEKQYFTITEMDEWYSLTNLIYKENGKAGEEKFENFENALTKFYLFSFNSSAEITLRVVAGQKEENINGTGEILVGSEPISDQFTLKIK